MKKHSKKRFTREGHPRFEPTGNRINAKQAQIVGSCILQIERRDGVCTPMKLLDEARAKSSRLHGYFDWDDSAAAESWRRQQASELIRSVKITLVLPDKTPVSVRAFVSVSAEEDDASFLGRGFVSTERALAHKGYRSQILADVVAELQSLRRKYAHFKELAAIWDLIEAESKKHSA